MIITNNPLLSILIPTYNYKIGIERIFYFFDSIDWEKSEVLIYDNSPNIETKGYVEQQIANNPRFKINYRLNNPATGPAENWNNLLQDAKGEYCLMLHNGEFPAEVDFFEKLIAKLENQNPDIAIMNCILADLETKTINYHLPIWFKSIVFKHFPKYIFKTNVIGPTSALIVKRKNYALFDTNLKWLLDVDSYYRSIEASLNKNLFLDLDIISVVNKTETLTSNLGDQISMVEMSERKYLHKKYNNIIWNQEAVSLFQLMVIFGNKLFFKLLHVGFKIFKLFATTNLNLKYSKHLKLIVSIG